jgi:hydrazine synthase alpha subunit-like protein/WD40 repeat protein
MSYIYIKRIRLALLGVLGSILVSACTSGDAGVQTSGQSADPVVVDFPIAYVKRSLPVEVDDNGVEQPAEVILREPINFFPGAALYIKDRATPSAAETNITDGIFEEGALYDIKDVDTSYDGTKLVFAMRAPEIEDADEEDQPTWNIWEYDHTTKEVKRVITSDINAEEGQDISPHYLPDGRIVFTSTRQRLSKAILLDEGKPQYDAFDEDQNVATLALHVMNSDGTDVTQITFNQSHDLAPSVLTNGKIVFSRWDNAGNNDQISLYQINPDGTGLEFLYGYHSHATGTDDSTIEFMQARQGPDGRLIVKLRPETSTRLGGELAFIDWESFTEINQTTDFAVGTAGPAQVSATPFEVRTDDEPSIGGRFSNVYPLFDGSGRFLISWTPCRLDSVDSQDNPIIIPCTQELIDAGGAVEAQPLYGIWSFDPNEGTQLPIVVGVEGVVINEIVAMSPRDLGTIIPDSAPTADQTLVNENVGIVHIESVYDFDGVDTSPSGISAMADPVQTSAAQRPARFIRIVKAVSLPDEEIIELDNTAFGRSRDQLMRDILGYAVVEPDGSAMFKVPANVAFGISVLDANGRRITERHLNWITVKAGEVKRCHGCHTGDSQLPHGRYDAEPASVNSGAPATGVPFPNTNPVLFADEGETMAEVYTRINGYQPLSVDISYTDYWTDPSVSAVNQDISFSYSDLDSPAPTSAGCQQNWSAQCRISINYEDEIQPIWEVPRLVFDAMGNQLADNTCITCHNVVDAMGAAQVPAGQLELLANPSADEPDHLVSYRELLFGDNAVELVNGALIDQLIPVVDGNGNPVFEVDEDGNLILDAEGNPIPVTQTVPVGATMRVSAANNSQGFFNLFAVGGSHAGRLTDAELKLLSEWLDIGGQYYNNPFDVPQD